MLLPLQSLPLVWYTNPPPPHWVPVTRPAALGPLRSTPRTTWRPLASRANNPPAPPRFFGPILLSVRLLTARLALKEIFTPVVELFFYGLGRKLHNLTSHGLDDPSERCGAHPLQAQCAIRCRRRRQAVTCRRDLQEIRHVSDSTIPRNPDPPFAFANA